MNEKDLNQIVAHEEAFRGTCARVEERAGFVVITNPDIDLPEANCVLRVRLGDDGIPAFLKAVEAENLSVLLDSGTRPAGLSGRFGEIGLSARGRSFIAVLEPETMVQPPGNTPHFTPVGPSELKRFTDLAAQAGGVDASTLLWSFRLRNLLFSAYLAEGSDGSTTAFALYHCGTLARLLGPYPAGPRTEFVVACRLIAKAWERAREKGAERLYSFVGEQDVDLLKPLGFRIDESFWFDAYARTCA